MGRFRIIAVAVLAVVAVVAGIVALALGSGGDSTTPTVAASPTGLATPTDVAAGVVAGAGVAVSVGRLDQNGTARSYLVLAPTTVDPTTPLIVALHDRATTPGAEAARDELVPYVAAGQAVLVHPVGVDQNWNSDDGCCGAAVIEGLDDVAFVGMVADAVRGRFGLTGPTDLIGYSNGGRLAYAIACRDTSRYAAVVTVSAAPTTPACGQAEVPVPVFAGVVLDDPELPTPEAPQAASTVLADIEQQWTDRNQCVGEADDVTAGAATVRTWTACGDGTIVETVAWRTGGHRWPDAGGGSPGAADLVWSFLAGVHQRAALAAG